MQIRNVLEHNDPVIDSLEDSYVEMASKSHMTLCDIAMEFNVKFYDVLMKATPKEFLHQALDVPPVGLTKQRTAMTLSSGNNYLFFERKPLKELYSDQRSVVLTATIENNNNN